MKKQSGITCCIFSNLDNALRSKSLNFTLVLALFVIENIQLMMLSAQEETESIGIRWIKYADIDILKKISSFNSITHQQQAKQVVILVISFAVLIIIGVIFLLGIWQKSTAFVFRCACQIYSNCLMLPIGTLLSFVFCKNMLPPTILIFFSGMLLLLAFIFTIATKMFLFTCTYKNLDYLRRNPFHFVKFRQLCLIMATFMYALGKIQGVGFARYGTLLCVLAAQSYDIYELLGRLNWFSQQIVKWNLGAMLASGVFAAVQLICVISGPKSLINRNFIYTYLVAFISTIFLTLNYRNYIIKNLIICTSEDISSDRVFQSRMRILQARVLGQKSKKAQLLRAAILRTHTKDCHNVECICKRRHQIWDPTTNQSGNPNVQPQFDIPFSKAFIKMIFEEGVNKYSDSIFVSVSYAYFLEDIFGLYMKVSILLKKIEMAFSSSISLTYSFLLFYLRTSVKKQINNYYTELTVTVNLDQVSKIDTIKQQLIKNITQMVELYSYFWKTISESVVDQNILHQTCEIITCKKNQIVELFQSYFKLNSSSKQLLSLIRSYGTMVVFNNNFEKQILKNIKNQNKIEPPRNSAFFPYYNYEMICLIKACFGNDGQMPITAVSNNFQHVFGYTKPMILGESLNKLMPKSYIIPHAIAVQQWKQSGRQKIMNKNHKIWAIGKDKLCFSCDFTIKPIIEENDLYLVGILLKKNDKDYVMINDATWVIQSTGTTLLKQLFLTKPELILDHEIQIQAFSPELLSFYHNNQNSSKFKEEIITAHFLIPKNIDTYLDNYSSQKMKSIPMNMTQDNPEYKTLIDQYVAKSLQNLIILIGVELQFIAQVKLTFQRVQILSNHTQYAVRIMKIHSIEILKSIPNILLQLKQNSQTDTHLEIAHLKSLRCPKLSSIDKIIKCFNLKKQKKKTQIEKPRRSFSQRKQLLVSKLSLKKQNVKLSIERIKQVFRRFGIFGRSIFSVFYEKAKINNNSFQLHKLQSIRTKEHKLTYQGIPQKRKQSIVALNIQSSDREFDLEQQEPQNEQIESSVQSLSNLHRRYLETKPEKTLITKKIFVIFLLASYALCRVASVLIIERTTVDMQNIFKASLSSAELFRCLKALSSLQISEFCGLIGRQYINRTELIQNRRQINKYVSDLLTLHLSEKNTQVMTKAGLYKYLDTKIKISVNLTVSILSFSKFYQTASQRSENDFGQSLSTSIGLMLVNYKNISQISEKESSLYIEFIRDETFIFKAALITLAVVRITLTIVFLWIIYICFVGREKWLNLCSQALCSVDSELSVKYQKYYKHLKFNSNNQIEDRRVYNKENLQNYNKQINRKPVVKGKISRKLFYLFFIALVVANLNELLIVDQLQLSSEWNKIAEIIKFSSKAQSQVSESLIKIKSDFLLNQSNLTEYRQLYSKTSQHFVNSIKDLFLCMPHHESYALSVIPVLKSNLCQNYPTPIMKVYNSQCLTRTSNKFGLIMNIQLFSQQAEKAYTAFATQSSLALVPILINPNWWQIQNTALYLLNACHLISLAIKQSIYSRMAWSVTISNIITYIILSVGFVLITLFFRFLKFYIETTNKVKTYIFLLPASIFTNSLHVKRFFSEFTKQFS